MDRSQKPYPVFQVHETPRDQQVRLRKDGVQGHLHKQAVNPMVCLSVVFLHEEPETTVSARALSARVGVCSVANAITLSRSCKALN